MRSIDRGLFLRKCLAPFSSNQTNRCADHCQAAVGIVGAYRQSIFCARCEHAIGFADALMDQIINEHANIGVGPIDNQWGQPGDLQSSIGSCDNTLCCSLFIAGRPIDLSC